MVFENSKVFVGGDVDDDEDNWESSNEGHPCCCCCALWEQHQLVSHRFLEVDTKVAPFYTVRLFREC